MTLPKSWAQLSQRTLVLQKITWDGKIDSATVDVPPARGPVLIAIDNADQAEESLTVTLEQKVRIDDTNASAQISEGDGVVTVTCDEPGPDGEKYSIKVVVPEVDAATDLEVALEGMVIVVTLAMKADNDTFIPDDVKNTAALVAAAINGEEGEEETGIPGFTAEASGGGSTPFTDAVDPVQFSGGTTEIYFSQYDAEGQELKLTVAGEQRRIFGPFDYFPRFLGGKITLTAAETPVDKDVTIVQVQEI
jgi:hypothetical protein